MVTLEPTVDQETRSLVGKIGLLMNLIQKGVEELERENGALASKLSIRILNALAHSPADPERLLHAARVFINPLKAPKRANWIARLALELGASKDAYQKLIDEAADCTKSLELAGSGVDEGPLVGQKHFGKMMTQSLPSAAAMIKQTSSLIVVDRPTPKMSPDGFRAVPEAFVNLSGPQMFELAKRFLQEGNGEAALALTQAASQKAVSGNAVWTLLNSIAESQFQAGRVDLMVEAYQSAVQIRPDATASWFNLGLALHRVGQLDEALTAHRRATEIDPENHRIYAELSATYFDMEDYEAAEINAERSLELMADYDSGWDKLSNALAAQNRIEEAIAACEDGLRFKPNSAKLLLKLGALLYDLDRKEEAQEVLNRAAALTEAPEAPYILRYNVALAVERNDFELALMLLESAKPQPGNWMAWNDLNLAYQAMEKFERAAWAGRKAIDFNAAPYDVWINLGLAYHRADMHGDAEAAYEQAITRQPSSTQAWHNMGVVLSEQKQFDRAIQALHRVTQLDPSDASAYFDLAVTLEQAGRNEEAAEARESAIALTRKSSGKITAARSFWNRILGGFSS